MRIRWISVFCETNVWTLVWEVGKEFLADVLMFLVLERQNEDPVVGMPVPKRSLGFNLLNGQDVTCNVSVDMETFKYSSIISTIHSFERKPVSVIFCNSGLILNGFFGHNLRQHRHTSTSDSVNALARR